MLDLNCVKNRREWSAWIVYSDVVLVLMYIDVLVRRDRQVVLNSDLHMGNRFCFGNWHKHNNLSLMVLRHWLDML